MQCFSSVFVLYMTCTLEDVKTWPGRAGQASAYLPGGLGTAPAAPRRNCSAKTVAAVRDNEEQATGFGHSFCPGRSLRSPDTLS